MDSPRSISLSQLMSNISIGICFLNSDWTVSPQNEKLCKAFFEEGSSLGFQHIQRGWIFTYDVVTGRGGLRAGLPIEFGLSPLDPDLILLVRRITESHAEVYTLRYLDREITQLTLANPDMKKMLEWLILALAEEDSRLPFELPPDY